MSTILDFYRDEPNPSGYSRFDVVHNWTDYDWELTHDFIQWVFPLPEASNFNPDAPLLSPDDIKIFRADPDLQNDVFQSFHRFLRFLGLACEYQEGHWVTNLKQQKKDLWEQPNHNWLRITRCLRSLRLLGLDYAADSFYNFLKDVPVTQNTQQHWKKANESA